MLIGKADNHFFTFDPHARTLQGMQSNTGKSTRVLYENLNQLFEHIQSLALSMGYSQDVECNLTGVHCRMNFIANPTDLAGDVENEFECSISVETTDEFVHDDVTFVCLPCVFLHVLSILQISSLRLFRSKLLLL